MFSAAKIRRAIRFKAPFLQCDKYFHSVTMSEMKGIAYDSIPYFNLEILKANTYHYLLVGFSLNSKFQEIQPRTYYSNLHPIVQIYCHFIKHSHSMCVVAHIFRLYLFLSVVKYIKKLLDSLDSLINFLEIN